MRGPKRRNFPVTNTIVGRIFFLYKDRSSREIGEIIGASGTLVQGWLVGRSNPTLAQIDRILTDTGCDGHWLLTGQGETYRRDPPETLKVSEEPAIYQNDRFIQAVKAALREIGQEKT